MRYEVYAFPDLKTPVYRTNWWILARLVADFNKAPETVIIDNLKQSMHFS